MEKKTVEITVLKPAEGMWLTKTYYDNESDRIFSKSVTTNTPNAWMEVSNEWKEKWEAEHTIIEDHGEADEQ